MPIESPSTRSVFDHAAEITSEAERTAYLEKVCAGAPEVRQQVEALLRAYADAGNFLEQPAVGDLASFPPQPPIAEAPGTVIGPYKLLEQIGEGGFGVVFLAEQATPIRRKVALKVIKPGMDTREVIARFDAERQALALMDHPGIAKVFDAGVTEHGRSYFVMELVQGVPITEYCDECNLPTRERLELFIAVCQAVQHAHQKGIIHRDLKPNNVLVAMQDGRAVPKIIDFGVAKALNQRLTEKTLATGFAQMIGTPLYMSPEQAELSPLGADTRSDIYSLGVVLYELLSGATPFDQDRLHSASFDELRRIIREEEPPRPSTRISTLAAEQASTVAERRRTDPRHLRQLVRGELDWIAMKCLEKDRNRRYETPNGLAEDLRRYLHDEPIQAGPPLLRYRFSKFVRRNRTLIATSLAIVAALLLGLVLTTRMYFRAATENLRAKAVSNFLQEMLSSADAELAKGRDYTVRQLLDQFSSGLSNQLAAEPDVEADIHVTIGRAYSSLRLPYDARPHFERAIQLRRNQRSADQQQLAEALVEYGLTLNILSRLEEAQLPIQEAIKIYHQQGVSGAPLFRALESLQLVLVNCGNDVEVDRVTSEALAIADRSHVDPRGKANLLHRYASQKVRQGRLAEGESLARKSVDIYRMSGHEDHPEIAHALRELANALQLQGRLQEAETALREGLAVFRRHYDEEHFYISVVKRSLRSVLEAQGDDAGIRQLALEVDEHASLSDGPDSRVRLASLLLNHRQTTAAHQRQAQQLMRRALEQYRQASIESARNLERRLVAVRGYTDIVALSADQAPLSQVHDDARRALDAEFQNLLGTFPDPIDSIDVLYTYALVRLRLRDQAAYRTVCTKLLDVPDTVNDFREYRRVWSWCLGSDSLNCSATEIEKAESVCLMRSFNADHRLALGGFLYRCGEWNRALEHIEAATVTQPDGWYAEGMLLGAQLFTAMTKWQLGEKREARQLLEQIRPAINEALESPATRWNYRATVEVLYREANELILPTAKGSLLEPDHELSQ